MWIPSYISIYFILVILDNWWNIISFTSKCDVELFQNNLVELCTPNDLGNLNLSNTGKVVEFIPWFANPDLLLQDFVEGFGKNGNWYHISEKMGIATKFWKNGNCY